MQKKIMVSIFFFFTFSHIAFNSNCNSRHVHERTEKKKIIIIAFPSHKKKESENAKNYKRSDKSYETNEFLTNGTLTLDKQSIMELEAQQNSRRSAGKLTKKWIISPRFCQWKTRKHQIIKPFIELLPIAWGSAARGNRDESCAEEINMIKTLLQWWFACWFALINWHLFNYSFAVVFFFLDWYRVDGNWSGEGTCDGI